MLYAINIRKRCLRKFFFLAFSAIVIFHPGFAQTMSITGPTCVLAGTQYTYSIAGPWVASPPPATEMTWSVISGTIIGSSSGQPLPHITVTFTGTGSVSVVTML